MYPLGVPQFMSNFINFIMMSLAAFVVAFVFFFSFENGSPTLHDTEDAIVTDGDWVTCSSDSSIAGRDFLLKRVQGCLSGQAIVGGLTKPAILVLLVFVKTVLVELILVLLVVRGVQQRQQ